MAVLRLLGVGTLLLAVVCGRALSQTPAAASAPQARTPAERHDQAWEILSTAATDEKHGDQRVQALAAVGLLGGNPRSVALLQKAMADHDVDIRTAAVLATGETATKALDHDLYQALGDTEPQVAFNAALVLAKNKNHAGDETLMAVIGGRAAGPGMIGGTKRSMVKTLHHPSTLAKMGAMQGAGMLLGPFGMGIGAVEYLRKEGTNSARVGAVDALAALGVHDQEMHDQFLTAARDKDPGLRVAAAKALSVWHDAETAEVLAQLMEDTRPPVRYTGAAAYLLSSTVSGAEPARGARYGRKR